MKARTVTGEGTLRGPGSELQTRRNWKSRAEQRTHIHVMGKRIIYEAYIS